MNVFYQGCEISATIIETYIFLDFLTRLLGRKYTYARQILIFGASFLLINLYMISANYIIPQYAAFQDIVVLILYVLYALLFTKGNLILKIITPAITITTILLINLSVLYVLSLIWNVRLGDLVIDRNGQRFLVLVITKALFFFVTRLVLRCLKPKTMIMSAKEYFAVALSFLCSVIIIVYFAEFQFHADNTMFGYATIIVLFSVVLINVASSILFVMLAKRNREHTEHMMIEVQFQEQQKMYQAICSAYKNLEILQHDMKNDLLSLQTLIYQGKNEEAENFIERYTQTRLGQFQIFVHTGFEMIDAVVNVKLNYAREKDIDVFCQISADFDQFETEDIVSLFSNAIDNAIESSVLQAKRYISIRIENKRNYLHITIGNAIAQSVLEQNAELLTTKSEKKLHGYGTQSMLHIVKKYDGMMEYYESNGIFFTDIFLKNTKQEGKTTNQEESVDF